MFGFKYSLHNPNPTVYNKGNPLDSVGDLIEDVADSVTDAVEDVVEDVVDVAEDVIESDIVEAGLDVFTLATIGLTVDTIEDFGDVVEDPSKLGDWLADAALDSSIWGQVVVLATFYDEVAQIAGISGTAKYIQLADTGIRQVTKMAIRGNEKAILQLGTTAIGILLAIPTAGQSLWVTIPVALYTSYGIIVEYATVAKALESGRLFELLQSVQSQRDMMNFVYVNGFINGINNFWMAGGILYDSPRAGDIRFKESIEKGRLDTTEFLNLDKSEKSKVFEWGEGYIGDYVSKVYTNEAGNIFFNGSMPQTKQIA